MQLKNIGEIAYTLKHVGTDASSVASSFGNMTIEAAKAAMEANNISGNVQYTALAKHFGQKEAEKIMGVKSSLAETSSVTTTLISKFSALGLAIKGAFNAHPFLIIGSAIATVGVGIFTVYKNIQKAQNEAADKAAQSWKDSSSSIQNYKDKITELKTSLESGSLTETEAYQAKSDLLDIQQQLLSSYGEQAKGIDLVNGSLDSQIEKLEELTRVEAQRLYQEGREGFDNSKREMEKVRSYSFSIGTGEELHDEVIEITKKYKDDGMFFNTDNYNSQIYFKGNAANVKKVLTDYITEIEKLYNNHYGSDFNYDTGFIDSIQSQINDNQSVLDEHEDRFLQGQSLSIYLSNQKYKIIGNKPSQTALDWLDEYKEKIVNLNKALLRGNEDEINEAIVEYEGIQGWINALLSDTSMGEFAAVFENIAKALDKSSLAAFNFNQALSGKTHSEFKDTIQQIKDMKLDDVDVKTILSSTASPEKDLFQSLYDYAKETGFIIDDSRSSTTKFVDALVKAGIITGEVSNYVIEDIESINTSFESLFKNETFSKNIDKFQDSISTINAALNKLESEGKLSNSEIIDLIQAFPALAGQTENLDEALSRLSAEKLKETIADIRSSLSGITDENELQAAENLISNLMHSLDLSKANIQPENIFGKTLSSMLAEDLSAEDKESLNAYNSIIEQKANRAPDTTYGNVDINHRPVRLNDDGSYNTLDTVTYNYSDFDSDKKGAFNVTPILPNGETIENLDDYIKNIFDRGENIEDSTIFLGAYANAKAAEEEAGKLHESQQALYKDEAEALSKVQDIAKAHNWDFVSPENAEKAQDLLAEFSSELETQGGKEILYTLSLDKSNADWTLDEWRAHYEEFKLAAADTFSSVISDEGFSNTVSKYTSDLQKLVAVKQKLNKTGGKLDTSDIKDLLTDIPELAYHLDDLENGVDQLIASANNDILQFFTTQIQNLRDMGREADANALVAYTQSIIESANELEGAFIKIGGLKVKVPDFDGWQNPDEDAGTTYDSILSGYEEAMKAFENGEVGTHAFKAFAKMISPTGSDDPYNFAENIGKFERYFKNGSEGCEAFLQDLQALNLAEEDNGTWTYKLGNNMDELKATAEKLGIGFEPMMAIFGKLEDYGFYNDFFLTEEDGTQHISDLYDELAAEKIRLAKIQANPNTADYATALEQSEAKIAELEERIAQSKESINEIIKNAPEDTMERAEYFKNVAAHIQEQITTTNDESLKATLQQELNEFALENKLVIDVETGEITSLDQIASIIGGADFNLNAQGEDLDSQISLLQNKLYELQNGNLSSLDTTQLKDAEILLTYLVKRKQELEAPAVMSINTDQLNGIDPDLSAAITTIQNFQTAYNELNLATISDVGTTESEAKIAAATAQLDAAREALQAIDPDLLKTLGIEITGLDDLGILTQILQMDLSSMEGINHLSYQFNLTNKEDFNAVVEKSKYLDGEHTATYTAVDNYTETFADAQQRINELDGSKANIYINTITTGSPTLGPPFNQTYSPKSTGGTSTPSNGPSNSTNINGTAAHGGIIGEPGSINALTGELGPELVVRGNSFFTVGDNGPEVVRLKKGDIVFNHKQTHDILTKGKTHTRGTALVQGNARAGGGDFYQYNAGTDPSRNNTNPDQKTTDDNTNSLKKNTTETDNNTKAKSKSTKVFDWVSKKLELLGQKTKSIADTITDYVSNTFKATQLNNQIKSIDNEISANKQAAQAYLKKADSAAASYEYTDSDGNTQSLSVPDYYKNLVQNGAWFIEDMDTSTEEGKALAEAIQNYQNYYEKAMDCTQAITDLKNTQLELYDQWINIPLDDASDKIEKYTKALNDLNSVSSIASSGASTLSAYKSVTSKQQKEREKAAKRNLKITQKSRTKSGNDLLSQISKNSKLDRATKKSVTKSVKSGTALNSETVDKLAAAGISAETKTYNKKVSRENDAKDLYKRTKNTRTASERTASYYKSNEPTYEVQNRILDSELNRKASIMDEWNHAVITTEKNADSAKKEKKQADQDSKKAQKDVSSRQNKILNDKSITSKLSKSQLSAVKNGEKVSLKGITDTAALKSLERYNNLIDISNQKNDIAKTASEKYNIALKAQTEALYNASEAEQDYAQAQVDNAVQKVENIKNYYDSDLDLKKAQEDYNKSELDVKESKGQDLTAADYNSQISDLRKQRNQKDHQADAMQAELDRQVTAGTIKEGSEEWKKLTASILGVRTESNKLTAEMHGLYDEMRDNLYVQFERAYEASERLRKSYATLQKLINDDMNFDDNGLFTGFGLLNLDESLKTYQSQLGDLETALAQRQSYINRFNAKNADGSRVNPEYSQKDFDEDMQEVTQRIQEALSGSNEARKEVISMIAAQAKAELDALKKVIDARKEAIKKKEEYYDYDKKLQSKTKEIQLLKQQRAAIEGVSGAEAAAQKARLDAQISEADEDLNETVREHVVDLQINGLSDLQEQLQENYENYVKDLNSNFDTMNKAMTAVANMISNNSDIIKTAADQLLDSFGVDGLNTSKLSHTNAPKYASGIDKIPRDMWAWTQEKGFELITHNGGIMTPLTRGDGVINHELTNTLLEMAKNYPNSLSPNFSSLQMPEISYRQNLSTIAPVIQCPITINGNANELDVISAVNKTLPMISRRIQSDIRKDLRKAGW